MPIIFTIAGLHLNTSPSRALGVSPNLCGGMLLPATKWRINGITKDSNGAILESAVVDVFKTSDDVIQGTNTSNVNGEYLVEVPTQAKHYAVAYKAGSPDVAGTTRNDLSPI